MYENTVANAKQPETLAEARQLYYTWPIVKHQTNMIDAETKAEWIRELRSGKYKQGRKSLKQRTSEGNTYCCLGVLCESKGLTSTLVSDLAEYTFEFDNYDDDLNTRSTALPHPDFMHELGFDTMQGIFYIEFKLFNRSFFYETSLIALNDDGFTFDQIADVIDYFF